MENLENFGTQELSMEEINKTEGGFLVFLAVVGVGLLGVAVGYGIAAAVDHYN